MQDTPAQEANGPVAEQAESASGDYAIAGSRRIYVAAGDRRGMELIAKGGDLNPNRLKVWNRLLSAASWTHVIDVGANYGEMLVNMNVDAATSVTAIEPNADILPLLHKTLAEAGIAATILPVATGDRNGVAKFFVNRNWSGMSRLAGTDTGNESATDFMIVPMLTLREIIGSEAANARLLVKIDVEGFERSVLAGLSDSLGQMDSFAALTEVLHLGDDDVRDILTSFDVYLYDIAEDKFVHVVPPELSRFKELRADPRHYWNDVVVRRRGDPAIGSR